MAKAKKLPSGSWRCLVYDYTDESGKRVYKSFTAETKKEAEYLAADYSVNKAKYSTVQDISIYDAVSRYIESKNGVLSPSTINSYYSIQKNYYDAYKQIAIKDINNTAIQVWLSDLSKNLSPKTVRNIHALLSATLEMFAPDFRLKSTLPAKTKPKLYVPSDDDIKRLLKHVEGKELELAILLAAFGPMRRGEICALTSDDITDNYIQVNKSKVLNHDGNWEIKAPKTYSSNRTIEYPPYVIEKLNKINGQIIKATPNQITSRFQRAVYFAKLPHFRFHDLRHYSASIMHAIGIPDQYIIERGGWATDNVMKTVYRNIIGDEAVKQNKKILEHFELFDNATRNATQT